MQHYVEEVNSAVLIPQEPVMCQCVIHQQCDDGQYQSHGISVAGQPVCQHISQSDTKGESCLP